MSESSVAGKVLVVDDEPEVNPMFRHRMWRGVSAGVYEFLFARPGRHALEVLDENPDVRLLTTDLNMPGKLPLPSGSEGASGWLDEVRPRQVVRRSGDAVSVASPHFARSGGPSADDPHRLVRFTLICNVPNKFGGTDECQNKPGPVSFSS